MSQQNLGLETEVSPNIEQQADRDRIREEYRARLAEKLKDPEFRKIEGFPIGTDEAILALSDPPYYTACPNPFIEEWLAENAKPYDPATDDYHREPFAADVSEGKNDPIYNAHSYHTKVPHKAIMRYILHYTEPGDVVYDGFCGTGMTGVAAQMCGDKAQVESLGYKVCPDGTLLDEEGKPFSKFGARKAILNDLSPLASFVSYNYQCITDWHDFAEEALLAIAEVESEWSWLYSTGSGKVMSSVWSDVFLCPSCSGRIVYWQGVGNDNGADKQFMCPYCRVLVAKSPLKSSGAVKLTRSFITSHDPLLNVMVKLPELTLVQQTIMHGKSRKIVAVDKDTACGLQRRIDTSDWPRIPSSKFAPGRQTNKLINGTGILYVAHMYTPRALLAYSTLFSRQLSNHNRTKFFRFCLTSINNYISRKQGYFGGGGGVAGTLYTPSVHLERNVFDVVRRKIAGLAKLTASVKAASILTTQSANDLRNLPSNSVDYIFTDPPFGESLQYGELNSFVEAWLDVKTHQADDCVLNYVHEKDIVFYAHIMHQVFGEYARVLKCGRWLTVEFHNSQTNVWSSIQDAIEKSGLIVVNVRILDKKQQSFNAINRPGAVDQDLVISAYKPHYNFEARFKQLMGLTEGVVEFLQEHLSMLPVALVNKAGRLEIVAERTRFLLFDRMVAYHLQRGARIPLSAADFYKLLVDQFVERDEMYFLNEQSARYDAVKARGVETEQLSIFVRDEKTAVQWVRSRLTERPQTLGDLTPQFMQELREWESHEPRPELRDLLREYFIEESDIWHVPDPNSEKDIENMRRSALLRLFREYTTAKGPLKVFRKEAVLEGFKHCWDTQQYGVIVSVCEKIPEKILQEIQDFVMMYDVAKDAAPTAQPQTAFVWE